METVLTRIDELSFEEVQHLAMAQGECQVELSHGGDMLKITTAHGTISDIFALGKLIGKTIEQKKTGFLPVISAHQQFKLRFKTDQAYIEDIKSILKLLDIKKSEYNGLGDNTIGWHVTCNSLDKGSLLMKLISKFLTTSIS